MRGIILEGLTGSGKTSVLNALRQVQGGIGKIYNEESTLGGNLVPGDVMDELGDASKTDAFRWRRLDAVLYDIGVSPAMEP